jgi:branched-chain amino acid transport system permease protein
MKTTFLSELKQSTAVAAWFVFLTFPIMVIRVNPLERLIEWRWINMAWVGGGAFALSFAWRFLMRRRDAGAASNGGGDEGEDRSSPIRRLAADPRIRYPVLAAVGALVLAFPFLLSSYQVNIMTQALIYVVLGLGLNITVGLAGLLDLGYVAFFAVGAYGYALLNHHFGLGFWAALPVGAALAALFGIILGFPILRLRGDYLAIVTLGFASIIRLVLENWNDFSFGPSGIANIPRPDLFGIELSLEQDISYIYFLMIGMVLFTIFVVNRLQDSRIGRAWIALREDEIACQAMGIDKTRAKLTAFALGATWAGMAGVMFAARNTFINPASFTFLESAAILSVVVLGGMGSIPGVILGALILILLPEYLRAFSDYRMLAFGAALTTMMVFRPQGLVSQTRRKYRFRAADPSPSVETE